MHKVAHVPAPRIRRPTTRSHLSATHVVRPARAGDVAAIHALVRRYASKGALLPRTPTDIRKAIDDFVVVVDGNRRVLACAALSCYSESLAEIGSVAVAKSAQGKGLGTMAVRGTEAQARERGIIELFAMTSAEQFFESLGYERSSVEQYPDKLARYEQLRAAGVDVVERSCYRKVLTWIDRSRDQAPTAQPQRQQRRRAAKQTSA
ncbi:MAG TPA: GNAT family N-acetyltransferase [Gemmatimonadaceae bacterium]|nr:GNAT family N-acetyltransferase [Gemmatimonadaceae bacterium]